ncbi:MAG: hypothetical protein HYU56_04665 [Candidatus Aenigmarchaeota archaeon]|nr:hypothetical protein [Candidatus Aenigmarchaeota archaeon]
MINKRILIFIIGIILLLIITWSPWITNTYAERLASEGFTAEWQDVMDGCGFNCNGCGIKESQRTLFGVNVKIEYACGMLPSDSPEYHRTDTVFVSFLGTIHGLQKS